MSSSITFIPFREHASREKELIRQAQEAVHSFKERFKKAIEEHSPDPSSEWELLSMYSVDELLRNLGTITLYDFRAVEYLVTLYFSHVGENIFSNSDEVLKIAESNFLKYATFINNNIPGLPEKYRNLVLESYYDLYCTASTEEDKEFYAATYDICPVVMEHCRNLHKKFTTPTLTRVEEIN